MATKIITVEATPPAESTGADYYKGAPLNAAEFDQNLVNLRAAVDRKASLSNPTFTGTVVLPATTSIGDVSATELQYLNSVTSNVQDQLNGKQATITTLATNKGGTGLTSFTSGGVVYASSTSALTTGSGLVFNGTALRVNSSSGIASYFQASGNGNTAGTTSFDFIQNSDNEGYIYQRANANIIFGTNNTERMRLDSSGNLGIGMSPQLKFDVFGVIRSYLGSGGVSLCGDSAPDVGFVGYNYYNDNGSESVTQSVRSSWRLKFGNGATDIIAFGRRAGGAAAGAWTDYMTLDSSGNLLVGTTSGTARLNLTTPNNQFGALLYNTNASFSSEMISVRPSSTTTNGTFHAFSYYNVGSAAYRFIVYDSGNVQNTNNSYGAISDAKLKENVVDATPKLAQLNQVRVVNYNLIGDERKQIGVIAQELEEIFPGMVDETPDYEELIKTREVEVPAVLDEDGNEVEPATTKTEEYSERVATGTTTKSVKYSVFVPMLIKAVQEQQAIIESLTQRIEALEYTKQGE